MRGDPWNHRRSFETEVKNRRLVPIDLGKIPVSVVLIGNSNSGKSTTTGHLVYKLVGIEDESTMERLNKLKYAWIVDKLKVERERGITIDANFFLVVDSTLGSFEDGISKDGQTREHALIANVLGVSQMICCINKVDGCYRSSIFQGDNLIQSSTNLGWYNEPTLLDDIEHINVPKRTLDKLLRVPIHNVYHIGKLRTIATGRMETGVVKAGFIITFGPSMITARVGSLQMHQRPIFEASSGNFVDVKVNNVSPKDIRRGDVVSDSVDAPMPIASFTEQICVVNHPGRICIVFWNSTFYK
ncbi:elongation factor 1-alpha, partial [Tanacetum coccineum]